MLYGRLTVNPISAAWNTVARFDDYAGAQQALDRLSDDGFPVEQPDTRIRAEPSELAPGSYAFARLPGAAAAPRAVSWAARPSRRAWRPNSKLSSGAPA